jgi:two-component system chemotaxis sensor kinase CheA
MDSHQQRFVEDALDLLNELDDGLMQLEANPQATAPLEQVFRTMHTIKGGANMFGFDIIGDLTHQLETLYDLVRQGKTQINDGLISITLHAFDKVRDLLKEKEVDKINNAEALKDHIRIAADFLKAAEINASANVLSSVTGKIQKHEVATFLVRIVPTISITAEGTHPLIFIIKDLEALGTARTFFYKKDNGEVAQWDIFLSTTSAQTELESYFIFVEGECKVSYKRLSSCNLFEADDFKTFIEVFNEVPCDLATLDDFISKIALTLVTEKILRTTRSPYPNERRSTTPTSR